MQNNKQQHVDDGCKAGDTQSPDSHPRRDTRNLIRAHRQSEKVSRIFVGNSRYTRALVATGSQTVRQSDSQTARQSGRKEVPHEIPTKCKTSVCFKSSLEGSMQNFRFLHLVYANFLRIHNSRSHFQFLRFLMNENAKRVMLFHNRMFTGIPNSLLHLLLSSLLTLAVSISLSLSLFVALDKDISRRASTATCAANSWNHLNSSDQIILRDSWN